MSNREIKAILISPLTALVVVLYMVLCIVLDTPSEVNAKNSIFDALFLFAVTSVYFLLMAYIFVGVVMVPFHYLVSKAKIESSSVYIVFGSLILGVWAMFNASPNITEEKMNESLVIHASIGFVVSYCFWFLVVRRSKHITNKSS